MGKKIVGFMVVVLVLATLWYAYRKRSQAGDGAVQFEDNTAALTDATKPSSSDATTTAADTTKRNIVQPTTNVQPALTGTANTTTVAAAAMPATDSISPNPANGVAFSGTGKFQVYRQGNLTWRVDTESGHTCILFATMEEWRKPIVYEHGCNNG